MSLQRITDSLAVLFASHPIVFWHDSEGEFSATVDNLALDNVNLVRLQETPALQIKMAIERQLSSAGCFIALSQNQTLIRIGYWISAYAVNHLKPIRHPSCWMI